MAARGYDDTAQIAEIDALMRANPSMSRKAAIRQVAGDDSLSRIEAKLVRRDAARVPEADSEDIVLPMYPTRTQAMLTKAEEMTLARSGESVRWSGFNDLAALENLRGRRVGPLPLPVRMLFSCALLGLIVIIAAPAFAGSFRFEDAIAWTAILVMFGAPLIFLTAIACCFFQSLISVVRGRPVPAAGYGKEDLKPVREQDTRRFVLTDKAFYAFSPDGTEVRIRRYPNVSHAVLRRTPDGEPVLRFGADDVRLEAVPGSDALIVRMGLRKEEPEDGKAGIAVPV